MAATAAEERGELEGERAQRVMRTTTALGGIPFQGRLFRSLPETPQKISLDVHQGDPASNTGARAHKVIQLVCGSPSAKKANCHARSESPRLSISTESSGPASGTGAQAHESYSLGLGLRVRRRQTTTRGVNCRASSSPPKAAA
jgi:hypothetical protein